MTKVDSKSALVEGLLTQTASAVKMGDLRRLRQAITDSWSAKVQHSLATLPEFRKQIEFLVAHVADQGEEQIVLTLAELGRLHTIQSTRVWVTPLVAQLLSNGTLASFQHGDGDQRHHAAIAVVASDFPVESGVLARAGVEEEKGEKARRVWIGALLARVPLSEFFERLTHAILETPDMSGQNRSLRLYRILEALNGKFNQTDFEIDESLSNGFGHFVATAFANAPRPQDYKKSAVAVEELLKTAIQLIRFRFRLGAEPEFYGAVALAERWLPKGGWIRLTSTSAGLKQLRRTLLEGLLLLLEQGKPDNELLKAHRALSPDQRFARKELNELEKSARNLTPGLRKWLVTGGVKVAVTKPAELDETDDLSIAMAMIVADDLSHRTDARVNAMLNDIRFKAPIHFETITDVVKLTQQLIDRVTFLANRRRLRLFGSPGEVVDFSPHAYRLPEDAPLARRVEIQAPGVEKLGRSASRVVVPALVEAFDSTDDACRH